MSDDLGTLHDVDGRWMVRFERLLPHPVNEVWRMVTEPAGLARWFPAAVAYETLAPGSPMTFSFDAADIERAAEAGVEDIPLVSDGVIVAVVRNRLFAFEWLGEPVRFELSADGDGCRLVFTHVFDPDAAQAPRNATGWHVCLEALEAALAGREAPPQARQAELGALYGERMHPS